MSVRFVVRLPRLSTPTSRTLIRSPSPGTGPAFAPRDRGRRRGPRRVKMRSNVSPRIDPVAIDDEVRAGPRRSRSRRGRRSRAGRSGRSGRVSRNAWPTATSRQARTSTLSASSVAEDLRRDDPGGQSRAGDCEPTISAPRASRMSDGIRNRAASRRATVEQLTESRDQCGQAGRGEAAEVRRPGVRPDPGGLHAVVDSCRGRGASRVRRGVYSSADRRAWRRRVIDQPALTTRRLVL